MPLPYPPPDRQIYTGKVMTDDVYNVTQAVRGQLNPAFEETWRMQRGRYLAGLGAAASPPGASDEPDWSDAGVRALEDEDDTVGSGIFDASGAATVHGTMGVFADHPSIPGYIARNPPFTVNRDVSDITSGADVVEVPGGGMWYVERGGRLVGPAPGNAPARQPRQVPPPTGTDQPYVYLGPRAAVSGLGQPPVPFHPDYRRVPPNVHIENMAVRQVAVGEDAPQPAGWGSYLVAGTVVGVAAALLMSTVGKKGRR